MKKTIVSLSMEAWLFDDDDLAFGLFPSVVPYLSPSLNCGPANNLFISSCVETVSCHIHFLSGIKTQNLFGKKKLLVGRYFLKYGK